MRQPLPGRVGAAVRFLILLTLLAAAACGIKGPPKPPLEATAPEPEPAAAPPDAGCCREPR